MSNAANSVSTLSSVDAHTAWMSSLSSDVLGVMLFTSPWHPPCKQMRGVCDQLAIQFPAVKFAEIDAEEVSDVTEQYPVESVPTSVLVRNGAVVASLEGANAVELTSLVTQHARGSATAAAAPAPAAAASSAPATEESKAALNARLASLVSAAPVMAFIKGTVEAPRCGFTKQLLALLAEQGVLFSTVDILSDDAVREGLKAYSNWPTYPQLYINGELIGGLDIVKEMAAGGELLAAIPPGHTKPSPEQEAAALNERLKSLIRQRRVMLFMKGSPEEPRCGFSKRVVALLAEVGCADYGSFDIFTDNDVREGLKKFSNWPTYPQLYINGELIGGLDVLNDMKEAGELQEMLAAAAPAKAAKEDQPPAEAAAASK